MNSANSMLPPGTSIVIGRLHIELALEWDGLAGHRIVHLRQNLEGDAGNGKRDEAIENAALMFRRVVGMEVIEDALASCEWPETYSQDGVGDDPESGEWGPIREI